jgi:hypothetical protein
VGKEVRFNNKYLKEMQHGNIWTRSKTEVSFNSVIYYCIFK